MRRRLIGCVVLGAGLVVLTPTAGFAVHCYVANKPADAGAVGFGDIKVAGNSEQLVAPGAFIDGDEIGSPVDLILRGGADNPFLDLAGESAGSLPPQPHDNGSETNGVLSLED
jgi:hypothetical protein